jgi:putative ubiquitin-RnfH superfamily antitoxin RatB of RatAB toxin-antitoxin module
VGAQRTGEDAALRVEIAYAEPQRAIVKALRLAPGSQVSEALRMASLDPDFAGVDLANAVVGIFGRLTRTDYTLQEGDRIEIYRPLTADPKAARRARAQESRRKR